MVSVELCADDELVKLNRHGQELEQPKEFLERLLAMKVLHLSLHLFAPSPVTNSLQIAKLQQTIDSLHALSSSYDKSASP